MPPASIPPVLPNHSHACIAAAHQLHWISPELQHSAFFVPRLCFSDGFSNGKSTKCCSVCTALQPFQPCSSTSHNPVQGYRLGKAQPREICSQQIVPGEHSCSDVSEVISLSFPNLEHAIWFCIRFKDGKRFFNNQELLISFITFALRKGFLFCLHQCDSHCVL